MVSRKKYKENRPLALQYILKKKFNIFLYSGILFSFLTFSFVTIPLITNSKKSASILGVTTSEINRLSNVSTIAIQVPISAPPETPKPSPTPITPTPTKFEIKNTPTQMPSPTTVPTSNGQYTAENIGGTTYRVLNVTNDTQMASSNEIFDALNSYRQSHGKTTLIWDLKLADFAKTRADLFASNDNLDSHAGFRSFMDNDGFSKIGFNGLGENSAMLSGNMKGERIIKEIFGADSDHDNNQLEASWQFVGVGVKDKAVNINFGKNKK